MCAFLPTWSNEVELGRVLQFSQKNKAGIFREAYRGQSAAVNDEHIVVLCCWYTSSSDHGNEVRKTLEHTKVHAATYVPVASYLCTIPPACLQGQCQTPSRENKGKPNVILPKPEWSLEMTSDRLILNTTDFKIITDFAHKKAEERGMMEETKRVSAATQEEEEKLKEEGKSSKMAVHPVIEILDSDCPSPPDTPDSKTWLVIGTVTLKEAHRDILKGQQWLNGSLVSADQWLLSLQFPQVRVYRIPFISRGEHWDQCLKEDYRFYT
jgi:hypothetical protein